MRINSNMNNPNNVNFKSRLEVKISEKYLYGLERDVIGGHKAEGIVDGINLLLRLAPEIGSAEDVITLRSHPNRKRLFLSFKDPKRELCVYDCRSIAKALAVLVSSNIEQEATMMERLWYDVKTPIAKHVDNLRQLKAKI